MAKNLEQLKKEIEGANTLKVRAEERRLSLRQQYNQKIEELKKLGVENPKEIENEIKRRESEIKELTKEIEDAIPSDIIEKYGKADFSKLSAEPVNLDNPF